MLEKKISADQIEVIADGSVQVRSCIQVLEDGSVISSSFHRHVVSPGDDLNAQDDRVKSICQTVHTPEVIAAFKAAQVNAEGIKS
jgi:hypothetical protein